MKYGRGGCSERGVILIVVVAVLAVLSLLAATFGMIMSMERAASRNQTEYEMARQAAQAGYEYLIDSLESIGTAALRSGGPPLICPEPENPFGSRELYCRSGLKVYFLTAAPEEAPPVHVGLLGKEWAEGVGSTNTGMFDLSGMGCGGDLGAAPHSGIRYTSFETSLARVIVSCFASDLSAGDCADIDGFRGGSYTTFANAGEQLRVARFLTSAIVNHRYGNDGLPGTRGTEDRFPEHLPPSIYWPGLWSTQDVGVTLPGHWWGMVGDDPDDPLLAANKVLQKAFHYAEPGDVSGSANTITDSTAAWVVNEHVGRVVAISEGAGAGQTRMITMNTDTTLTVAPGWVSGNEPDATSRFVILPLHEVWLDDRWNAKGLYTFNPTLTSVDEDETISDTTGNILTLSANLPGGLAPAVGDCFGIYPSLPPPRIGAGDSSPSALLWPNGGLCCEPYVWPRVLKEGVVAEIPKTTDNQIEIDARLSYDPTGYVIRIVDGNGRGQVRRILSYTENTAPRGNLLTLAGDWAEDEKPTPVAMTSGAAIAGCTDQKIKVTPTAGGPWQPNEHAGRMVRITSGACVSEGKLIAGNTPDELTVVGAFSDVISAGETFEIGVQTYRIEHDFFASGTVSAHGAGTLQDTTKGYNWTPDAYIGCVVNIYYDTSADAQGQTRLIIDNDADTLTLARNWRAAPTDDVAKYRIELPQDTKYRPDNLQGDDIIYRSVAEILPVMTDALQDDGLNALQAGEVAAIIYNAFRNVLTVSTGSAGLKSEGAGINDPRTDGIDNDNDGIVDNEFYTTAEYAQYLYDHLGLREWAHADGADVSARVGDAAQLVANIIDFRDRDDVPTQITDTNLDPEGSGATVFGYEGVHVTEVMATPPVLDYDGGAFLRLNDVGCELTYDGVRAQAVAYDMNVPTPPFKYILKNGDPGIMPGGPDVDPGWDWNAGGHYWEFVDPVVANGQGTWVFDMNHTGSPSYDFRRGFYAIRIKGSDSTTYPFQNAAGQNGSVTTDATGWGYVRLANQKLMAVEVDSNDKLTFKLTAPVDASFKRFYGFQLLPQYVEITNCAAHDVQIDSVTVPNTGGTSHTFHLGRGTKIRGAAADGTFPIRYGTFVIAMSEEAYERNWGVTKDGVWGDEEGEDYPVFFVGDISNANADNFLIAAADPAITVKSMGKTIAATGADAIDGAVGTCTNYLAQEKPDTPFKKVSWEGFNGAAPDPATSLAGSQNQGATAASRTCLNARYTQIWATYPALHTRASFVAAHAASVWPVILNRPYPTPGWLGLVPTGHTDWRTVDPDPTPDNVPVGTDDPPSSVEQLLGTLMERALVGGVHTRINLNHPLQATREHTLKAGFSDAAAQKLAAWRPAAGWQNWDHLLTTTGIQDMFGSNSAEDSGAGAYADDFVDDPDEKEEWARRYSNIVSLKGSTLKYVVAGLVFEENAAEGDPPVASVRIEVELDISGAELAMLNFRYVME